MIILVMVGLLLLIIGLAGWYLYAELRDVIQRAEREFEENEL